MNIENSAKAVIIQNGKILLLKNQEQYNVGIWYCLPGGRQKFGEDLSTTLIRECEEEIGVKVKMVKLLFIREYIHKNHRLGHLGSPSHKIEFMFLAKILDEKSPTMGSKVDSSQIDILWVDIEIIHTFNVFPSKLKELKKILEEQNDNPYWGDLL